VKGCRGESNTGTNERKENKEEGKGNKEAWQERRGEE